MGRNYKDRVCPICKKKFQLKSSATPLKAFSKKYSGDNNPIFFCSYKCYKKFLEREGRK